MEYIPSEITCQQEKAFSDRRLRLISKLVVGAGDRDIILKAVATYLPEWSLPGR
jgi:hypothetical protein